ncbi:MAG: Holliday junction resolvase RuvX [Planctomycetes bacterium]|nr:Holliday junction resolvase RuvX [Planctomycetota bacterium]
MLAGIDYGTVRIGVAMASWEVAIATPCENYTRRGEKLDAEYFRTLAADERIERFVVGLPVHLDGSESAKSTEARQFGKWLREQTGVKVVFFDERYTSQEAKEMLGVTSLTSKKRKRRLDMLAAQIMLTAYLESRDRGEGPPQGLDE